MTDQLKPVATRFCVLRQWTDGGTEWILKTDGRARRYKTEQDALKAIAKEEQAR